MKNLKEYVESCYCWESGLNHIWRLMEESMKLANSNTLKLSKEKKLASLGETNQELWSFVYNLLQDVERVGLEIARCKTDLALGKEKLTPEM